MADSSPSIICLFGSRGPSAIVWFISSAILASFDSVKVTWARAHIGEEQDKIFPPVTNSDATGAVIAKAFASRIVTSLKHRRPYRIFGDTVGLPMCAKTRSGNLFVKASARPSPSGSQVAAWKESLFTAIALAFPQLLIGKISDDGQATKALARNVYELHSSITLDDI
jgi:hypothetical protein